MKNNKRFLKGFLTGTLLTVGAVAGVAYGLQKIIIEPIEEQENTVDENRRKAMRKSRAR